MGGQAKAVQVYPPKLCTAIVAGFAQQLKMDTQPSLAAVEVADTEVMSQSSGGVKALDAEEGDGTAKGYESEVPAFLLEILQVDKEDGELHAAEIDDDEWIAEDDVHGGTLPGSLVRAARQQEIKYLQSRKVYSYSTDAEAWSKTRKKPLKLKWIDTNKGDRLRFNY